MKSVYSSRKTYNGFESTNGIEEDIQDMITEVTKEDGGEFQGTIVVTVEYIKE